MRTHVASKFETRKRELKNDLASSFLRHILSEFAQGINWIQAEILPDPDHGQGAPFHQLTPILSLLLCGPTNRRTCRISLSYGYNWSYKSLLSDIKYQQYKYLKKAIKNSKIIRENISTDLTSNTVRDAQTPPLLLSPMDVYLYEASWLTNVKW